MDDHVHPPGVALAEQRTVPPKPRTQFQLCPQCDYENLQVPTSNVLILAEWLLARKANGAITSQQQTLPPMPFAGPEKLPVLQRVLIDKTITAAAAFTRPLPRESRNRALMHGYVGDRRLRYMLLAPQRWLQLAAEHAAVIAPDFSMYDEMPSHQRLLSAWLSRACTAYFQHHGIKAIPNLRWTSTMELEVLLDGLPSRSCIAISTQSLLTKDGIARLSEGIEQMTERIEPAQFIIYGRLPGRLRAAIGNTADIINIPTDISRAHNLAAT